MRKSTTAGFAVYILLLAEYPLTAWCAQKKPNMTKAMPAIQIGILAIEPDQFS
jgi:hypothetical protein